jgi:hypothetical protein
MKKLVIKAVSTLFIASVSLVGFAKDNNGTEGGYIYIKPIESSQKEFSQLDKITYFKIYVDGDLIMASNNLEDLQNHIVIDTYKSWSAKDKREVKVVYTLNDNSEITYSTVKQTSSLLSQNIYFLN